MSRKRANKKGCKNNSQTIVLATAIIQLLTAIITLIATLVKTLSA